MAAAQPDTRVGLVAGARPWLRGSVGDVVLDGVEDDSDCPLDGLGRVLDALDRLQELCRAGTPDQLAVVTHRDVGVFGDHGEPLWGHLVEAYRQLSGEIRG